MSNRATAYEHRIRNDRRSRSCAVDNFRHGEKRRSHSFERGDDPKRFRRGYYDEIQLAKTITRFVDSGIVDGRSQSLDRGDFRNHDDGRCHSYHKGRDRSMERSGRASSRDWKCMECMTWNVPDDDCCARCGAYFPDDRPASRREHPANSEQKLDEFGRVVKKSSLEKTPPEWPPCFESNGSAFVFDARSGMFYEAESDFFYDPKSKLYYGNKKQTYFRYDGHTKPPFVEVHHIENAQASSDLAPEPVLVPLPCPKSSQESKAKKAISIKLKTKCLKSTKIKKDKSEKPEVAPVVLLNPKLQKEHSMNIDKWSDRQVEKRVEERKIERTAKGEPLCALCKRKFPSVEKLLYHEKVSKLHQENVAKAAAGKKEEKDKIYLDRAQQRRILYGPETPSVGLPLSTLPVTTKDLLPAPVMGVTPSVVDQPSNSLSSESNIGSKLLQKMGWKQGKALGARPETENPIVQSLARDWERIEALAAKGGAKFPAGAEGLGS